MLEDPEPPTAVEMMLALPLKEMWTCNIEADGVRA